MGMIDKQNIYHWRCASLAGGHEDMEIDFNFIDKVKTVIYSGTLLMDYGKLVLSGTGTS